MKVSYIYIYDKYSWSKLNQEACLQTVMYENLYDNFTVELCFLLQMNRLSRRLVSNLSDRLTALVPFSQDFFLAMLLCAFISAVNLVEKSPAAQTVEGDAVGRDPLPLLLIQYPCLLLRLSVFL